MLHLVPGEKFESGNCAVGVGAVMKNDRASATEANPISRRRCTHVERSSLDARRAVGARRVVRRRVRCRCGAFREFLALEKNGPALFFFCWQGVRCLSTRSCFAFLQLATAFVFIGTHRLDFFYRIPLSFIDACVGFLHHH